jgi:hypothetical protein
MFLRIFGHSLEVGRRVVVGDIAVDSKGLVGGAVGVSIERSGLYSVDNAIAVERNYFILYFIIRLQLGRLLFGDFVAILAVIGLLARNKPLLKHLLGGLAQHVLALILVPGIRHVLII